MNKQRKVVITTTYNEMGIIIDTKAKELGSFVQPEPCEDAVSRKTVKELMLKYGFLAPDMTVTEFVEDCLPPAQPQHNEILYRHYKGGTYELVCNNVTHTETGESLVVYRDCRGQLWARPESMFYGLVKVGDDLVPRFVLCRSEGGAE